MADFWRDTRFLITGAHGFLGMHVVDAMRRRGARFLSTPQHNRFDLRNQNAVGVLLEASGPDVIIHLAANVGGIGANQAHPAEMVYDNAMMGMNLIHEAWRAGVSKFVTIGTVCSYPKHTPVPFIEDDLWNGYPEETNAPYGIAKKLLLVQGQAYREQYDFNVIHLLPVNLYGPGDNFDPASSHVIPALIRRMQEAVERGDSAFEVWGTGAASREFLYVADAAEGICEATEHYDGGEPVNLGSGQEIRIGDLAALIAEMVGFKGALRWDTSKPDGQPRRCLDTSRAREQFGWEAQTSFREGLRASIDWYIGQIAEKAA